MALEYFRIILLASTILIFIFSIFLLASVKIKPSGKNQSSLTEDDCLISGCNGEICQDKSEEAAITVCLYKPEYECYQNASCQKQKDGHCGWTQTEELKNCLRLKSQEKANYE